MTTRICSVRNPLIWTMTLGVCLALSGCGEDSTAPKSAPTRLAVGSRNGKSSPRNKHVQKEIE